MDREAFAKTLAAWHGVALPERLQTAIAATAGRYAEVIEAAAPPLAFDDEPAHFLRSRKAAAGDGDRPR
jgi:hypothetical protein